jgi:hypothetical protein
LFINVLCTYLKYLVNKESYINILNVLVTFKDTQTLLLAFYYSSFSFCGHSTCLCHHCLIFFFSHYVHQGVCVCVCVCVCVYLRFITPTPSLFQRSSVSGEKSYMPFVYVIELICAIAMTSNLFLELYPLASYPSGSLKDIHLGRRGINSTQSHA